MPTPNERGTRTQKTQPRELGATPVEIPVPKRKEVLDVFRKASKADSTAGGPGK